MRTSSSDFKTGQTINDRYEVLSVLGVGCMGAVYKVEDLQLGGSLIALKLLAPDFGARQEELERFRREVVLLRKIAHPNVVSVYDFGTTSSGRHFYTMEFVEGQSLYSTLYNQYDLTLKADELMSIMLDISEGLASIHRAGIIHCDIKPENIMVEPGGRIKLTDFGLSSDLSSSRYGHSKGVAVGTPFYMSPEQFRGENIDLRADIYAAGLIAYEMAVRDKAFFSTDYYELAELHFREQIPDIRSQRKDLPEWYAEFVERCTQKSKDKRFQSAEEMLKFLRRQVAHRKEFKRKRAGRKTTFFDSRSLASKINEESEEDYSTKRSSEIRAAQISGLHVIADAHYLLGSSLLSQSKLKDAAQHLELAHQLDPYNSEALFAHAALAERVKDYQLAVKLYQRVLKRDSHSESAYLALGMLHYRLGNSQEALIHLGTFVGIARGQEEFEGQYSNVEQIVQKLERNWSS